MEVDDLYAASLVFGSAECLRMPGFIFGTSESFFALKGIEFIHRYARQCGERGRVCGR